MFSNRAGYRSKAAHRFFEILVETRHTALVPQLNCAAYRADQASPACVRRIAMLVDSLTYSFPSKVSRSKGRHKGAAANTNR